MSVVLMTDFGLKDTFVGVLKGVIAGINPETDVIDLTHEVDPQNIAQASFLLTTSYSYFPEKTIFCVVVDPGVGSERKGICIQTKDYYFIGPDNGVLWNAANENGIQQIVKLENPDFFLGKISNTFHGRDVFAPAAANLSKGLEDITLLGCGLKSCVELEIPDIVTQDGVLRLKVIHIDHFGNIVINLTHGQFEKYVDKTHFIISFNDNTISKVYDCYSQADDGEFFLVRASCGFVEISLKNSDAAKMLGIELNADLTMKIVSSQT